MFLHSDGRARIRNDAQVYEDTSGLTVGDQVIRSGKVRLEAGWACLLPHGHNRVHLACNVGMQLQSVNSYSLLQQRVLEDPHPWPCWQARLVAAFHTHCCSMLHGAFSNLHALVRPCSPCRWSSGPASWATSSMASSAR